MVRYGDSMGLIPMSAGFSNAYILHLPGEGKKYLGHFLKRLKEQTIAVDKEVTVITTATTDTKDSCPLVYQLEKSGQAYINSADGFDGEWRKTVKLPLILRALQNVTTPYVFLLDANDVVILRDIDQSFIDLWRQYDCDILFNGSQYLYPKIISAPIEKEHNSPFVNHYLNAGVCFGYTDKIKQIYETAYYHSKHEHYAPYDSEQYYVRIGIIEEKDIRVKIDDGSCLFLCSHGN